MNPLENKSPLTDCEAAAPEDIWLLGFGDLSTLILCFFLALLISSPVNPAYVRGNASLSSTPGEDPFTSELQAESVFTEGLDAGTSLAHSISRESYREVILLQSHFAEEIKIATLLQDSALKGINLEVYEVSEVVIETCSPQVGVPKETEWYMALSNALSTRRQLVDAGFESKRIQVGVLGPWCELLESQGIETETELAGVLRIKISRKDPESTV